jgi:translation initiation factor 2B subunit (eIF-2B alpha/beta/delta family)
MLDSLNDLINSADPMPESSHNLMRTNSHGSLVSWADSEELAVQLQHTRSILREAEQTNAKLEAQVDLLKKELRRNESNNISVQHINQNFCYFKNVMLKFLAPEKVNDGRTQMLPVLGKPP